MPFRVFDKFKNKIQNFILRFCFYLNMKKINSNNSLPFSCLINFYFGFLMFFIRFLFFIKNGKRNKIQYSFFIFMKKLKKELLKKIKINFMVIFTSIVYTVFRSKFVSSTLGFPAVQWSQRHQESVV